MKQVAYQFGMPHHRLEDGYEPFSFLSFRINQALRKRQVINHVKWLTTDYTTVAVVVVCLCTRIL